MLQSAALYTDFTKAFFTDSIPHIFTAQAEM
jgi:hypothetical protein